MVQVMGCHQEKKSPAFEGRLKGLISQDQHKWGEPSLWPLNHGESGCKHWDMRTLARSILKCFHPERWKHIDINYTWCRCTAFFCVIDWQTGSLFTLTQSGANDWHRIAFAHGLGRGCSYEGIRSLRHPKTPSISKVRRDRLARSLVHRSDWSSCQTSSVEECLANSQTAGRHCTSHYQWPSSEDCWASGHAPGSVWNLAQKSGFADCLANSRVPASGWSPR